MGFDVSQSTQDEEQRFFTLNTNMPIPLLVYGDSFPWAKYGHHILPSSLDLTSNSKAGLNRTFLNSLIEFLRTDLDGNYRMEKSIFHLESPYYFQAGSLFVKIT
jgi:hypothetical protein